MDTLTLGFIQNIGPMEWIIILVVMLLLFGRRLPEVGKSLGKGIVEFKKGLKGVEDEVEMQSNRPAAPAQQAQVQGQSAWMSGNQQLGGGAQVPAQPGAVGRAEQP